MARERRRSAVSESGLRDTAPTPDRSGESPHRLVPYYRAARRYWGDLTAWWPGEDPWEIAVSAVLTQHARWDRAWQALERLRRAGLRNPEAVARVRRSTLERLIRPAGGFRRKARTLQELARWVLAECGGDLRRLGERPVERARSALLSVYGIGFETADAILLYACDVPVPIVDAYTVRVLQRHGLLPPGTWRYPDVRRRMTAWLEGDARAWKELHAQMVMVGKTFCKIRSPLCSTCPWGFLLPGSRAEKED